ncbi:MAG: heme-binding protein [Patescibacteria group bacterium]|nr:heme-binding protein [Patescibacteria group bacterium]
MITLEFALEAAIEVIKIAGSDGDSPIAVGIAGANRQLIVYLAMDGIKLQIFQNSILKKIATVMKMEEDRFMTFHGAFVIRDRDRRIMGAIGVSGRHSNKNKIRPTPQNHELAQKGYEYLNVLITGEKRPSFNKEMKHEDLDRFF